VAVHLAGAILAIWALGVGLARIFRPGELIVPVFAVAIVANLGAYMISTRAQDLLVTYQPPSGTRGKEKLPIASQRTVRRVET